jgi:hypothetical protein
MMTAVLTVEDRLTILEKKVAELKQVLPPTLPSHHWLDQVSGSFKDDPEFDKILRLGREIRQAERMGCDEGNT